MARLQVTALPVSAHVTAERSACMLATVAQIRTLNEQVAAAQGRIDRHMKAVQVAAQREAEALLATADPAVFARLQPGDPRRLQTVPRVGDIVLAELVAYAHDSFARRDRRALRCLAGVAPVTLQSGRHRGGRMRRAANRHLRNAMHAMAATVAIRDPASKYDYQSLRDRGCRRGHALRAVADRLLRIMFAMLRDGTDFDPQRASRWLDDAAQIKEENGANES